MLPKYKNNNLTINTHPLIKSRIAIARSRLSTVKSQTPIPQLYRWSKSYRDYVKTRALYHGLFKSKHDFYILWNKNYVLPREQNYYTNKISPNRKFVFDDTCASSSSETSFLEDKIEKRKFIKHTKIKHTKINKQKCIVS